MAYECYECRLNSDDPSAYMKEGEPATHITIIEDGKPSIEVPICFDCKDDLDDDYDEDSFADNGHDPLAEENFLSGYADDEWP